MNRNRQSPDAASKTANMTVLAISQAVAGCTRPDALEASGTAVAR
jgi:hypothetical protein